MADTARMRAVVDTNVVVSGLLWRGPSREILDAARAGKVELFTSAAMLAELWDVLSRDRFAPRLAAAGIAPRELVMGFAALALLVEPVAVPPTVLADPEDDAVLAAAVAASAEVIVSGDRHLLDLNLFRGIKIVKASEFVSLISLH